MHKALAAHTFAKTQALQKIDSGLFQDARPHSSGYIVAVALFDDHALHASLMQEMRKEKPRRAGADNGYLGSHKGAFSPQVMLPMHGAAQTGRRGAGRTKTCTFWPGGAIVLVLARRSGQGRRA